MYLAGKWEHLTKKPFICSKSAIEALGKGEKYVQSHGTYPLSSVNPLVFGCFASNLVIIFITMWPHDYMKNDWQVKVLMMTMLFRKLPTSLEY